MAAVVADLEASVANLQAILGLEVAFRDPGAERYGLRNAVFPIGDTFLELLQPMNPSAAAARFAARRGGECGYMVSLQGRAVGALSRPVAEGRVRAIEDLTYEGGRTIQLHPADTGGAMLSVDVADRLDDWVWAGSRWRQCVRTGLCTGIRSVEIDSAEPSATALTWAELLGLRARARGDRWRLLLDQGEVAFSPSRAGGGDGLAQIDLMVRDPEEICRRAAYRGLLDSGGELRLCGLRIGLLNV